METNVKFEFDGYTVICEGYVVSPGHCEGLDLTFEGVELKDVSKEDYKIAKELGRELLIESVYNSELSFY